MGSSRHNQQISYLSAAAEKAERNYYDQLYLDKQAEARRKLAYDYNMVGSVNKARK